MQLAMSEASAYFQSSVLFYPVLLLILGVSHDHRSFADK
jgi:hypothetical protein